jgi:hypothetical protein
MKLRRVTGTTTTELTSKTKKRAATHSLIKKNELHAKQNLKKK